MFAASSGFLQVLTAVARVILSLTLAASITGTSRADFADVTAEPVVTGLGIPVAATHAGDERLFVSLLGGQVKIVKNGVLRPEPFLDLTDRTLGDGFGLWSIAFHPDFASNGLLFVHYAETVSGDSIIARYQVSEDPDRADPASEAILLRIPKAEQLHYGGQLQFGPDGFLYVSTGDGTGTQTVDPQCAAQSIDSLEGKILRLDVNQSAEAAPFYGIPADNPFVGSGRGEIWAFGLRNPWRFSFDHETGDLWISDVGHSRREEINLQSAASPGGENYGWKVMEGSRCFGNREGCAASVPECDDPGFTAPALEYDNAGNRCAVIGGYRYRGHVPALYGRYLYGDYCSGEVWAATVENGSITNVQALSFLLPELVAFGEDAAGELYLMTLSTLYRLTDPTLPDPCLADENHLCLTEGRFRVSVRWQTAADPGDLAQAVGLTADGGYFWFFNSDNPEVFVKVLDACVDPFQHFWVFAAGLTDVETSLMVLDTLTGESRRYDTLLGEAYQPITDTQAFATCP